MLLDNSAVAGIGIACGLAALLVFMIILCVCCGKMEKCCLKWSLKRNAARFGSRQSIITDEIKSKRDSQISQNAQLREKYGIKKSTPDVSTENESSKKKDKKKKDKNSDSKF